MIGNITQVHRYQLQDDLIEWFDRMIRDRIDNDYACEKLTDTFEGVVEDISDRTLGELHHDHII